MRRHRSLDLQPPRPAPRLRLVDSGFVGSPGERVQTPAGIEYGLGEGLPGYTSSRLRRDGWHDDLMDPRERLAILETILAAAERSREVIDAVWNSATEDEARERLRQLLGVQGDVLPQVVLDLQISHMTGAKREAIAREIDQVRPLAEGPPNEAP